MRYVKRYLSLQSWASRVCAGKRCDYPAASRNPALLVRLAPNRRWS